MAQPLTVSQGRPSTPGEAQLWFDIQDLVGPAGLWPHVIRRWFWTKHLNYMQRQIVSAFVFINGLDPSIFLQWVNIKNLARDQAAHAHFAYLFDRFEQDPKLYGYGLYAYNVTMACYQKINGDPHTYSAKKH